MTGREVVKRTIMFTDPGRFAYDFPEKFGSDFVMTGMKPSPDARLKEGTDEWGAVWKSIGDSEFGEVKDFPVKEWKDLERIKIPDVNLQERWDHLKQIRKKYPDKFILCSGISLYERVHFLRGLENTWTDIYENENNLNELLEILVDMNLNTISRYSKFDIDGYIFADDWGLQNSLMINPEIWRKIWKPRYKKVFQAAHDKGFFTFLHSCGYIIEILDDLIEVGLDVIHMDQQENMGLSVLSDLYKERITFFATVDIQKTMARGNPDEIKKYCRDMYKYLGNKKGGLIPRWYNDPIGAGHKQESIDIMCEEFFKLSKEIYGN